MTSASLHIQSYKRTNAGRKFPQHDKMLLISTNEECVLGLLPISVHCVDNYKM